MINDYNEVKECVYKDEHYSVRDNGAIFRHKREGKRLRFDDERWTFGFKNSKTGYMLLGDHRVHIIVATAFLGERDSKKFVVDHIDTNRCNNRVENLRWFTRLENALNNEITRSKIIYICGSIEAFIENQKYDPFDTKQIRLIIESKHDHNAIGSIDLIDIDLFNSRACIGILIYGKAQGLGYATEALEITKRYCFEVLALRQIYCNIAADNDRSLTLFKHCGFEVSGVKKAWRRSFNGWIDEHFLQCINKINT